MASESSDNKLGGREELMAELDRLGIESTTVEHPEVGIYKNLNIIYMLFICRIQQLRFS